MSASVKVPADDSRVQSIDAVRGLIMVIMALDHVRDFFSATSFQPTDLTKTSELLFFTRWITHLCAPTFIFLSGVSIYFYARKTSSLRKTSVFLLTRGLWLILVEIFVIGLIITQGYSLTLLEVIWAIGCSMILLTALIWLPRAAQIALAMIMILGHNALPPVGPVSGGNMLLALLHNSPFFIASPPTLVAYTIVPWVGVMLVGFWIGEWFTYSPQRRDRLLLTSGGMALILFIALRYSNVYGDPFPWGVQERGGFFTFLSFMNVTKSPPSLLFLSVTLGVTSLLLVILNKLSEGAKQFLIIYGRVPFFYFMVHFVIISASSFVWTYLSFGKGVNLSFTSPKDWPADYSPSLLRAYFVWILLIAVMYFPCRWYARYKAKSGKWWASYL